MIDDKQIIDKFIKFEADNNLFERKFCGFSYWIYIRFTLYNLILQQLTDMNPISLSRNKIDRIGSIATKILDGIKQILSFKSDKESDLLIFEHPRKVNIDNINQDIYTYYLDNHYGLKAQYVDERSSNGYMPRPNNNFLKWDAITLNIVFLIIFNLKKDKAEKLFLSEITKKIEIEFNVKLSDKFTYQTVYKNFILYTSSYNYIKRKLLRIKPKLIVEVVYYNQRNMVVNEVAAELKIPTVELQHGTMGSGHIAYNFDKKQNLAQMPDYIFLFSDYWKLCSRLPMDDSNIKITGYPYFEKQVKKLSQVKKSNRKIKILFVSQTTISHKLSKFAVELSNLIDLNRYEIIFKLHPAEFSDWQERMKELYDHRNQIRVVGQTTTTLYELFSDCDIQVGVYSTGIYEGFGFGLKTYIAKIDGYNRMIDLVDNGYAELVSDAKEMAQSLDQVQDENNVDSQLFWQNNSEENIIYEINKLLEL